MSLYISFTLTNSTRFPREKNTLKKFVWELEALTEYLLHHFESNFVLHAAARLSFMVLFCRTVCFTRSSRFIRISVFSEPVLFSFIMFTEIFKFVDFCVSVRIMGVSVRAWFDALKRDSHAESVRLDRYAEWFRRLFWRWSISYFEDNQWTNSDCLWCKTVIFHLLV